jgi:hypothetical protein
VPPAIGARRLADDLPEGSAEGPKAGETDREADVGDGAVSLTQEKHRALDPPPLQVAVGVSPKTEQKQRLKWAGEMWATAATARTSSGSA